MANSDNSTSRKKKIYYGTIFVIPILLTFLFPLGPQQAIDSFKFAFGLENDIKPKIDASITPISPALPGMSQVTPVKVENPFASAGQPVVVKVKIRNIGDQLGYPYNQISLMPNQYALKIGVDIGPVYITPEGEVVHLWEMADWKERLHMWFWGGLKMTWSAITQTGRTCKFTKVDWIPDSLKEKLKARYGGFDPTNVWIYDCIRMADEDTFNQVVKSYCPQVIDNACIGKMSAKEKASFSRALVVELCGGQECPDIPEGHCKREGNFVKCSIGNDGIPPGDEEEFTFYALVPADAPVSEAPEKFIEKGYTLSASCSGYGINCHTIYLGVYPVDTGFWASLKAGLENFWASIYNFIFKTKITVGIPIVDRPIAEGQGIFFVVGPALQFLVTLFLWGAFIGGSVAGYSTASRVMR